MLLNCILYLIFLSKYTSMYLFVGWQLWVDQSAVELQAPAPNLGSFEPPFDNIIDFAHVLSAETWEEQKLQGSSVPIAKAAIYSCQAWQLGEPPAPYSDHDYPQREKKRYLQMVYQYLNDHIKFYAPRAHNGTHFDFSVLVDPLNHTDPYERLLSQYLRLNMDGSELYVLSVKGSTKYRLAPGNSGFDNLFLAGDWTNNPINAGCVEGTVLSGVGCAKAFIERLHG